MVKVGVYNEDGEPIGFDYVYDDEPENDPYDDDFINRYDRDVYTDDDDDEGGE